MGTDGYMEPKVGLMRHHVSDIHKTMVSNRSCVADLVAQTVIIKDRSFVDDNRYRGRIIRPVMHWFNDDSPHQVPLDRICV